MNQSPRTDPPGTVPARTALPSAPLRGRLRVPGDKSISHRAIMLGGLAEGVTTVKGLLEGADILSTVGAVRAFGARVSRRGEGAWEVEGRRWRTPETEVDCGNAGTGVRLLMGVAAGQGVGAVFTGDASLRSRPMGRIIDPLSEMGARFSSADGRLPARLEAGSRLSGIRYTTPKASAQIKSAVLLAGLGAEGTTTVVEWPTRDHTENMLRAFGVGVEVKALPDGRKAVSVEGGSGLTANHIEVPGDPSSAAFAAVAASVVPGSDVVLEGVMLNPRRDAVYDALRMMGADIVEANARESGGERVADLRVRAAKLSGAVIPAERASDMIDEYPVLAVAAAFAEGETVMDGLEELRVKESDRISATVAMLRGNGVEVEERPDGMTVRGGPVRGGGTAETHHDHRIAMSALVLGLASETGAGVDDATMIATSYPDFFADMEGLGARFG